MGDDHSQESLERPKRSVLQSIVTLEQQVLNLPRILNDALIHDFCEEALRHLQRFMQEEVGKFVLHYFLNPNPAELHAFGQRLRIVQLYANEACAFATAEPLKALAEQLHLNLATFSMAISCLATTREPTHASAIPPLGFDVYQYLNLANNKSAPGLPHLVLESIVGRYLHSDDYFLFLTRPSGGPVNYSEQQSPDPVTITLASRCYWKTADGAKIKTQFFSNVVAFEKYVDKLASSLVCIHINGTTKNEYMRTMRLNPQLLRRPEVSPVWNLVAFINGVYDLLTGVFIPNEINRIKNHLYLPIPQIFIPHMFDTTGFRERDYILPPETFTRCQHLEPCDCPDPLGGLATPHFDSIMTCQKWPRAVCTMLQVCLGRMLYLRGAVGEKHQFITLLYGVAGSGKSTLAKVIGSMLHNPATVTLDEGEGLQAFLVSPGTVEINNLASAAKPVAQSNVFYLSNAPEQVFGLSPLMKGPRAVICNDVTEYTQIPQHFVMQLAEHSLVPVAQKNRDAGNVELNAPSLFCMNGWPKAWNNQTGEMARRFIYFLFLHVPDVRNDMLETAIVAEIPRLLRKFSILYRSWANYSTGKGLDEVLHPKALWAKNKQHVMVNANPLAAFWNNITEESPKIRKVAGAEITAERIEALYREYTVLTNQSQKFIGVRSKLRGYLASLGSSEVTVDVDLLHAGEWKVSGWQEIPI